MFCGIVQMKLNLKFDNQILWKEVRLLNSIIIKLYY